MCVWVWLRLCWCWCNGAGEGRAGRAGRTGQGRRAEDARGRQDQAAHAAWYTLSLPTYRARMTPAGVCVRADEARGPGAGCVQCRRAGVQACGRGQSGEARNRPAQRQMRDETSRRHETGCWPGDASFGRQDATKTSQHPRPRPLPPPRPSASSSRPTTPPQQQPHPHPHPHSHRDANRSAAAGYKRPLGPGGISAVPSCPVPGPGCRTCHLLAMPS
jgi:hypothetical protein